MSEHTQEVRFKVTEEMHRRLHALATANGEEVCTLMRRVTHDYIQSEIHKHILRSRLLRGEGVDSE